MSDLILLADTLHRTIGARSTDDNLDTRGNALKEAALPMDMLIWLQESALAQWVGSAPTLLAYPTILTLHTAGMSVVVGTCAVIDLRILGVAGEVPFASFRRAPLFVWSGFTVNAITGALLFLPAAEQKATQTAFFVKLAFIALALLTYGRIQRLLFRETMQATAALSTEARTLTLLSLVLWTGATVAGRLMAYTQ